MLRHFAGKVAAIPRDKLFWSVLAALALGQLLAFWMLCIHQVRKAEVRDATLQVQRVAVADCLRYVPRATLNSCAARVDPNGRADTGALAADTPAGARGAAASLNSTVPVTFSVR